MSSTKRANIRRANKASSSILSECITNDNISWSFKVVHADDLQQNEKNSIWALFETNMHELYVHSSFGWEPNAKRNELFDTSSRFILAFTENSPMNMSAFLMFRFEYEDSENVVYCYELQVVKILQRSGIGKALLRHLASIGTAWKMEKIMLTVFKGNTNALKFYSASGFIIDSSSPSCNEGLEESVDYEILSRSLWTHL